MARSHQRGTLRLEHNSWVGYMNLKVLDPTTGESKWKKQRVGVLGAKAKITKHQAQDLLEGIISEKTGQSTEPRADERIVTLGWFTRNRFFLLREGSTWRESTAANRRSAIEKDILAKFGDVIGVAIENGIAVARHEPNFAALGLRAFDGQRAIKQNSGDERPARIVGQAERLADRRAVRAVSLWQPDIGRT